MTAGSSRPWGSILSSTEFHPSGYFRRWKFLGEWDHTELWDDFPALRGRMQVRPSRKYIRVFNWNRPILALNVGCARFWLKISRVKEKLLFLCSLHKVGQSRVNIENTTYEARPPTSSYHSVYQCTCAESQMPFSCHMGLSLVLSDMTCYLCEESAPLTFSRVLPYLFFCSLFHFCITYFPLCIGPLSSAYKQVLEFTILKKIYFLTPSSLPVTNPFL